MDKKIKLSGRELDIMNVLWESERPLVAREIADADLNINTVRMMLKGLLSKNYIKVADIVRSGTVLTQSYIPVLSAQEYMINQMTTAIKGPVSQVQVIASLLQHEENEAEVIKELENMLKERKENIIKDN